jgi:hypothetical protein
MNLDYFKSAQGVVRKTTGMRDGRAIFQRLLDSSGFVSFLVLGRLPGNLGNRLAGMSNGYSPRGQRTLASKHHSHSASAKAEDRR